jgi:hypothetical protein
MFLNSTFMRSKLHNRLTTRLSIVMCMFEQQFQTLENFPYAKCIK